MTTEGKSLYDAPATNRAYRDIQPTEEWKEEHAYDTLLIDLPGFKKDNLKVQVTSLRKIRVSAERPLGYGNQWERFRKEYPIPSNCDPNEPTAKFDNYVLYVMLPKTMPPSTEAAKPPSKEASKPPTVTEALKAPKEAPKAATEALKPQKPMSASEPQPPKTNANYQEHDKKTNIGSSSQENGNSKSTTSHVEADLQARNVAQKRSENEKIEDSRGKEVEDSMTREEYRGAIFGRENIDAGVDKRSYTPQGYNYKQVINGLVMELKQQPRKLVNLGLAFLFILVLGLYVKHAINSIQEFKHKEL